MLIDDFYTEHSNTVTFTRDQGSDFAKQIADDFNPLHNPENSKFCIPGDLLFALILSKYGISQQMEFTFSGMVTEKTKLNLPPKHSDLLLSDDNGKNYMHVTCHGDNTTKESLIDSLTKHYVAFSGQTFPHILVPLLKTQDVMINPSRPMVIYQKMIIHLQTVNCDNISLELDAENTSLELNGKRGNICLAFHLFHDKQKVGTGEKHMVLSGLKAFEQKAVDALIDSYNQSKLSNL